MKKIYTFLFIVFSVFAFGQESTPFSNEQEWMIAKTDSVTNSHLNDSISDVLEQIPLPQNARWLSEYTEVFPVQGPTINYHMTLSDSVVVINGLEYREILSGDYCSGVDGHYSRGYIRAQDSSWYYTYNGADSEELYFKFNAVVGEVFNVYSWTGSVWDGGRIVVAIDSIQLQDGSKRKRIVLDWANNGGVPDYQYWIEGIGSQQMGIRYPVYLGGLWHFWDDLRCFMIDDEIVFQNVDGPCCVTVNVEETSVQSLNVYPNPFDDSFHIQLPWSAKWRLCIYNTQGALVKEENNSGLLQHSIDMSELPSGVYFLQCRNEKGKIFSQKLLKQ